MRLVEHVRLTPCYKSRTPARVSAETGFLLLRDGVRKVQFQSPLERGFVEICDFANEVVQLRWEPFSFAFRDAVLGTERRYTPDYLVETTSRTGGRISYVVEIKADRELQRIQRDPTGLEARAHIAADRWCREQPSFVFATITERWLDSRGLANVRLIGSKQTAQSDNSYDRHVVNEITTAGDLSLDQLVALDACRDRIGRAALTALLLNLCSRDVIHFDITRPLGGGTVFYAGARRRIFKR